MRRSFFNRAFVALAFAAACDTGASFDTTETISTPAGGKADQLTDGFAPGRCLENGVPDACGGPGASGDCSCDAACVGNGDCCYDYQAMCGGSTNFVKLQINEDNVQEPIYVYSLGGAPASVDGFRFEAAQAMFNRARYLSRMELGYDQWGSLASEPPFTAQVAGLQPGATWYQEPDWRDPEFLPRYADVLLAWGRFNLSEDAMASLEQIVKEEVIDADRRERGTYIIYAGLGGDLPSSCHPQVCDLDVDELEELEHKSIYAFSQ